jgi:UPF0716 family protein affecting phage T7 exclusion
MANRTGRWGGLIGLMAVAVWIGLELVVFDRLSAAIGGGPALLMLVGKSVLGAVIVVALLRRKLSGLRGVVAIRLDGPEAIAATLGVLAAVLLVAPGFVTGILGLLLLVPPLRRLVGRGLGTRAAPAAEGPVDLDRTDWTEVKPEAPRRLDGPR